MELFGFSSTLRDLYIYHKAICNPNYKIAQAIEILNIQQRQSSEHI